MPISKRDDLRLKLGNFFLAATLSVVPTAMTICFLGVHGFIVCKSLENNLAKDDSFELVQTCKKVNIDTSYKYVIWIWMFITIPTWRWFYIGHYRRVKKTKS